MGNRQTDALHYTVIPSVPGVSGATLKAVAWELAFAADNETGTCFPSYRDTAERAGLTRRWAIEAVAWLEAIVLLVKQGRMRGRGKGPASNLYTFPKVVDIPPAQVEERGGVKAFEGWGERVPGCKNPLFTHPLWCREITMMVKGVHHYSEEASPSWCGELTMMVQGTHHDGDGASPESLRELPKSTLKEMLKENDSTATTSPSPVESPSTGQGTCQSKSGDGPQEKPKDPAPGLAPARESVFEAARPVEPACPPAPQGPPPQPRPSPPLIAKFESTCPKCTGVISPGDPITGMKGSYSHVSCPERPVPPPDPDDRVVGGVTYRKEGHYNIEDPDRVVYIWSRVGPGGSLDRVPMEDARSLGLPLDEREEFGDGVTLDEDDDEFGQSDASVPAPEGDGDHRPESVPGVMMGGNP
jgi:hypothetical protein